jgi:hypothetical protein
MQRFVYKLARPGGDPHQIQADTRAVLDGLDGLGLNDALPEVREALARLEELDAAARTGAGHWDLTRDAIVRRLAAGEIGIDEAIGETVDAQRRSERHGVGADIIARATRSAAAATWRLLVKAGDSIVTDHLAPLVADTVALVGETAATLPPTVTDHASAIAAGPKAAAAWLKLTAAHDRWSAAQRLADNLRRWGVLSVPAGVEVTAAPKPLIDPPLPLGVFRFRRLDLTTPPGKRHPALALADDHAAGAGPGLYTGAEVDLRSVFGPDPLGDAPVAAGLQGLRG